MEKNRNNSDFSLVNDPPPSLELLNLGITEARIGHRHIFISAARSTIKIITSGIEKVFG